MPRVSMAPAKPKHFTAGQLVQTLAPFKTLCTKHAISQRYRTLELSSNLVRGMNSFGLLEMKVMLALGEPCAVDGSLFLSVLDSLPSNEVLKLLAGDGVLDWKCGNASGRLAKTVLDKPLPTLADTTKSMDGVEWEASNDFFTSLELGAISVAGNSTLASVGMYGVVLDNRKGFAITSCDNTTACYYNVGKAISGIPDALTLPPEGARVLGLVAQKTKGNLVFGKDSVLWEAPDAGFYLRCAPPLKADIAEILSRYGGKAQHKAMISPDAIAAFIRRVNVIAETKKNAHVTMSVSQGQLGLSFEEGIVGSEETYLVEGLEDCPDIEGIQLSAEKLARALSNVNTVTLDHASKSVVTFEGLEGDFKYIVCGRTTA